MKKADRLTTKALSQFEQAHSDLLEAARLRREEAESKRAAAKALDEQATEAAHAAAADAKRAERLGTLLDL